MNSDTQQPLSRALLLVIAVTVLMLQVTVKINYGVKDNIEGQFVITEQIANEMFAKNIIEEETYSMPTACEVSTENENMKVRIAGTDKWNDLIYKVSMEEEIDPVFVKCIMAIESAGNQNIINYNKNNTTDYGLMQVNTCWGNRFDYNKMMSDPEYAIRSGIQVIKYKIDAAERAGNEPTAFEVAWRYNGYSDMGKRYANKFVTLYNDLNSKSENSIKLNNKQATSNNGL